MRSMPVFLAVAMSCSTQPAAVDSEAQAPDAQSQRPSAPIQGGTLARSTSGTIVFADPGLDTVDLVRAAPLAHVGIVSFEPGDRPSRVETDATTAFVVLRGAGAVAAIDLESATVQWQEWVCPEPRGIAVDDARNELAVACASGELVTLARDGALVSTVHVDSDLRDVVIDGERTWVSRFRSAEVLELDRSGQILTRQKPPAHELLVNEYNRAERFLPSVAWRMLPHPDGGVAVLHQRGSDHQLETRPGTRLEDILPPETYEVVTSTFAGMTEVDTNMVVYYGPPPKPEEIWVDITTVHDVYNGPDCRSPVVHSAVTWFPADGEPVTSVPILLGTLAVDMSIDGSEYVFASAAANGADGRQIAATSAHSLFNTPLACLTDGLAVPGGIGLGSATSVTGGLDQLVIGSRYPREIRTLDGALALDSTPAPAGFELFHEDPGSGISCASCHAEGLDDGHVWRSEEEGNRRTMRAGGGIASTAPYHWDGSLYNMTHLMAFTFEGRMGAPSAPSHDEIEGLLAFLDKVPTPAVSPRDSALVESGKALFVERSCASCHSGDQFTNDQNESIGKLEPAQTPSLVGVGLRAPLMQDGCAKTLEERFTRPSCGGVDHGNVGADETEVIEALVAYLETL